VVYNLTVYRSRPKRFVIYRSLLVGYYIYYNYNDILNLYLYYPRSTVPRTYSGDIKDSYLLLFLSEVHIEVDNRT